jgi:hypothetical protein
MSSASTLALAQNDAFVSRGEDHCQFCFKIGGPEQPLFFHQAQSGHASADPSAGSSHRIRLVVESSAVFAECQNIVLNQLVSFESLTFLLGEIYTHYEALRGKGIVSWSNPSRPGNVTQFLDQFIRPAEGAAGSLLPGGLDPRSLYSSSEFACNVYFYSGLWCVPLNTSCSCSYHDSLRCWVCEHWGP